MVNLIWATRGRSWGFRFLLKGGYPDPLAPYESAFMDMEDAEAACRRLGDRVALRFPDPVNRTDSAGRIIPHNFVVLAPMASSINSMDDGLLKVWPLVASVYELAWQAKAPPPPEVIQSMVDGDEGECARRDS